MGTGRLQWRGPDELAVDGIEFGLRPGISEPFESSHTRFCLGKARWAVEALDDLVADLAPRRLIDVGINQGGSAALLCQLADPERLVGVELSAEPVQALASFARARGLSDALSIHYGVDQADAAALQRIAGEEFGRRPVDLVIDDASHMLAPSRITFESLFPILRPGGLYLLEDWSWAHMELPVWPRKPPLTSLVFEMIVACGHSPEVIAEVNVNRGWAVVRRGDRPLEPEFTLSGLHDERGRQLLPDGEAGVSRAPVPAGVRAWPRRLRERRR